MAEDRFEHYRDFWPYYLREHAKPETRALHFFGTGLGISLLVAAIATLDWTLLPAALIAGYLFAWIGHFMIEKNRPATFKYPTWSLYSDFRMLGLWLAGKLDTELDKAGVDT